MKIYYELNNGLAPDDYEVIDTFENENEAIEAFENYEGSCDLWQLDLEDPNYCVTLRTK